MSDWEYLSCAETAKLVRGALARAFPRVKFSVRSSTYSGGASISVHWTDGPSAREVEAVAGAYAGGDFDGMIDLAYNKTHVLMPDGTARLAHSPGTKGSRGSHPEIHGLTELAEVVEGARLVHFGADYVFCTRDLSEVARERVEAYVKAHAQADDERDPWRLGLAYGGRWWSEDLQTLVRVFGELLADPQAREAQRVDEAEHEVGQTRAYGWGDKRGRID